MDLILLPLLQVINLALQLYVWVIFLSVALNWLILFQIINTYQPLVRQIASFCFQVTEPFLAPLRRLIPFVGGFDLSPLLLLLLVYFIQNMVGRVILRLL